MRAVVATKFGDPGVLEVQNLPNPTAGTGQVIVDVQYSDVGTLDRLVRSGWGQDFFDVEPPYIPGDGVGGVVRSVGTGVDEAWIGRRVVGGTGPRNADGLSAAPTGGYADTALVDVCALVAVPDALDLEEASALLNDGPTSQMLIDVTDPQPGDTVLILAAAGAAGVLLAQLVSARGATVIAAARGNAKAAALRRLGVEHVLDYSQPEWTQQVLDLVPEGPSVIFDGAGSQLGQQAFALVADSARVVTYGSSAGVFAEPDGASAARRQITVTGLFDLPSLTPEARNHLVRRAFAAAQSQTARPVVTCLPLDQASDAHQALQERTAIAKTLLTH